MMNRSSANNARGFSTLQLIITIAIVMIVTGFAVVSISRAREHVRLMNSARQFAAYVERARGDSIRRHAEVLNGATVSVMDNNTYAVTMDWDGVGTTRTQNFDLETGVVFTTGIKAITFNWRGRITQEESFGFSNGRNTVSVGVTGSGDVTFDAQFFPDASLPPVALNGTGGGVQPEPGAPPGGPPPGASPDPHASPTPPGGGPSPTPTGNPSPTPTGNPSPTPTATASPNTSPSPGASPSPGSSPSPAACTLGASPDPLIVISDGSGSVSVTRTNGTGNATISASSSNSGQIQVTPSSVNVSDAAAATFQVTVKKNSGSVTFSSSGCSSKTVTVTVH